MGAVKRVLWAVPPSDPQTYP